MLIPKDNIRDLEEIDQTVRAALNFIPVETVDQVFAAAHQAPPALLLRFGDFGIAVARQVHQVGFPVHQEVKLTRRSGRR